MAVFVALLRAVNVGGTGKLPMSELKRFCTDAGFSAVRTYIATGNAIFETARREAEVKAAIEAPLAAYAGRHIPVLVRTAAEMAAVVARNPFPDAHPSRAVAFFIDAPPPADVLQSVRGRQDERLALGTREIYVAYGADMGHSKLKIPAALLGTARNMNTIAKLAALAAAHPPP